VRILLKHLFTVCVILLSWQVSFALGADRYATIDRDVYLQYEYYSLKTNYIPRFILNQPYKLGSSKLRSLTVEIEATTYAKEANIEEGISLKVEPGWLFLGNHRVMNYPSLEADGYIKIGRFKGVNRLIATRSLGNDANFHGDTHEWVSAYFIDAYGILDLGKGVELFGGRTPRNYGIPNEYSLFLSNYSYSFDHFGFSATGRQLKYSYYTGRLNDMLGWDDEGIEIPSGVVANTKRYIAFQRLDWIISQQFQLGLSQATLYGGSGQTAVSAYMNPLNFYYLSQRNQDIQMNGSWQVNLMLRLPQKIGFYIDFYIDDFIINNNSDQVDRDLHPDRLAIMSKVSVPDIIFEKSLATIRYVRVWNETYVSYRNYENWVFYDKGLGFPNRSYEGLKLEYSIFANNRVYHTSSLALNQIGDRSFQTTLVDSADTEFPAPPVTKAFEYSSRFVFKLKSVDAFVNIDYHYEYVPQRDIDFTYKVGMNYRFNFEF
jgi:hypothetical protein